MPRLGFPRAHSVVTSTTSVTHRCVRCGERDVHGVRHERARTWNVERWATTALSRDPAATRVTAETADLRRRINLYVLRSDAALALTERYYSSVE